MNIRYYVFSISGFSEESKDFAEDNSISLIDLNTLYGKDTPTVSVSNPNL